MKNFLVVCAVGLSLLLSGYTLFNRELVVKTDDPDFGSIVGPYSVTPSVNFNGMRIVGKAQSLATGTSTVCAIISPTSTSTLLSAGVKFDLASTAAVVVDLAKGTTQYATSTRIGTIYSMAASAQATIVASSTGSVAGDATIFGPSTYFVVKYQDANNGTGNASTGKCWASFVIPTP